MLHSRERHVSDNVIYLPGDAIGVRAKARANDIGDAQHVRAMGRFTLLSGLLALACNVLLGCAVNFNFDAFANAALLFDDLRSSQIAFLRWGMIADLWGYYLLFVPAALYLSQHAETSWRNVLVCAGTAYAAIGAIGAAILATTGVDVLRQHVQSDGAQPALRSNFLFVYSMVNDGMWNLLEMGLFGIFMLGVAPVLRKVSRPLYCLTVVLGAAGIIDTIGHTLEWQPMSDVALNTYLLGEPIWAIWLGVLWMRRRSL